MCFDVVSDGDYKRWEPDEIVHIEERVAASEIIGNLNDEEIPHFRNRNKKQLRNKSLLVGTLGGTQSLAISQQCSRIKNLVTDIETQTQNQLIENSISELEFEEIIGTLENLELDTQDILRDVRLEFVLALPYYRLKYLFVISCIPLLPLD